MPSANPLEQLRRRLQSQATPAAFAALAEEHRRAGHFDEAIAVCRDGLSRYPTYVSARVTLGRALLDSGAVLEARTELEQAVAQAPDNLAAVRALDAARAACADLPVAPPPPLPSLADLTLQAQVTDGLDVDAFRSERDGAEVDASAFEDAAPTDPPVEDGPAVSFDALATGADGPQEFGLAPDWTLPDAPPSAADARGPAEVDLGDGLMTQALELHADAPTMYFTQPHPQGEEPAGIWPVPTATTDALTEVHVAGESSLTAPPVFSWAIDAPSDNQVSLPPAPVSSLWDETGPERPNADVAAATAGDDESVPAGMWGGLFEEPVGEGAEPASFAGWDAPGPATSPDLSAWANNDQHDGPATGLWDMPVDVAAAHEATSEAVVAIAPAHEYLWEASPAASEPSTEAAADNAAVEEWSLPEPATASDSIVQEFDGTPVATWTADAAVDEDPATIVVAARLPVEDAEPQVDVAVATDDALEMNEPVIVETSPAAVADLHPAAKDEASPEPVYEATWAGSVASALDEVFRLAGQPARTTISESDADDPHHAAMASAAVDAARDDAAGQGGSDEPTLASLQQMLDAVRARRAALFVDPRTH